jgi:hypothetical protein
MPDVFRGLILKLSEIGAFNFLFPFMITSAIFYGLLRKSQIFGPAEKNVALHAVISLSAAFMVWAFPVINGVDIQSQLSTFFMQGMVVMLILMVGLMVVGMILPEDLPKHLWEKWKDKSSLPTMLFIVGIAVGVIVFITSGLVSLFLTSEMVATIPTDILLGIGLVLVMILPLIWIAFGK